MKVRVCVLPSQQSSRLLPTTSSAEKKIVLIRKKSRVDGLKVSSVAVAADHGGYELKEKLKTIS